MKKRKLITRQVEAARNRRWSLLSLMLRIKQKNIKLYSEIVDLYYEDVNPRIHFPKRIRNDA